MIPSWMEGLKQLDTAQRGLIGIDEIQYLTHLLMGTGYTLITCGENAHINHGKESKSWKRSSHSKLWLKIRQNLASGDRIGLIWVWAKWI